MLFTLVLFYMVFSAADAMNYKKTLLSSSKRQQISVITDRPETGEKAHNSMDPVEIPVQTTVSPSPVPVETAEHADIVSILFLGTDRTDFRDNFMKAYRTDTIILILINLQTLKVKALVIPRDTYVMIPQTGEKDKINHAYVRGGMGQEGIRQAIAAVQNFTGIHADYYFMLDLEPIPRIVDSLGGVELDVEIDMKTHGANLSKGYQLLDGLKAYDYIHWRYGPSGDIGRIRRQKKFIRAMFSHLKYEKKLVDAVSIIFEMSGYVSTNMGLKELTSLSALAYHIADENIAIETIPGSARLIDGVWYWIPDTDGFHNILLSLFSEVSGNRHSHPGHNP